MLIIFLLSVISCLDIVHTSTKPELKWWQTSIIYQIYPRSFKDSNGDGVGDLNGIISKLDHFVYLGVKAIWLSPFYPSPNKDFGYDISNHTDVHSMFGTLEDFKTLLEEAHDKGIKVIIDFVPNHTSDLHPWFQASIRREEPFTDFYIWTDGQPGPDGVPVPPNNWISIFGGSAWTWNERRQQFYYHNFLKEQPDLNYRNSLVVKEMDNVVRFWIDLGVDGLRCDAVLYLLEVEDLSMDEPISDNVTGITPFQYEYLNHVYTSYQPDSMTIIQGWKNVINEYKSKDRFMVVEVYETPERRHQYVNFGADFAFNFDLITPVGITSDCDGVCIHDLVDKEYSTLQQNDWPNFQLGNHDRSRIANRKGRGAVNALNMLLLTLKGTPTTYYGEEIGMEEIQVSFEDTWDPFGIRFGKERYAEFSRDPVRSPLQWDDSYQSGFTTADKPWLPVHSDYKTINIKNQILSEELSPIQLYRQLAGLRQQPSFQYGHIMYAVVNENIFSYIRHAEGFPKYLVAINFGKTDSSVDFSTITGALSRGTVVVHAGNFKPESLYTIGTAVSLNNITLKPDQGVVIKVKPANDEL